MDIVETEGFETIGGGGVEKVPKDDEDIACVSALEDMVSKFIVDPVNVP